MDSRKEMGGCREIPPSDAFSEMEIPLTPSARSTQWLRKNGFIVAKVEQIIHMPNAPFPLKRDAFYFGDLLIAQKGFGAALVQVTSSDHVSHRVNKINGIPQDPKDERCVRETELAHSYARIWLASGNRIFVHGWAKRGPRGAKKKWTLTEMEIL